MNNLITILIVFFASSLLAAQVNELETIYIQNETVLSSEEDSSEESSEVVGTEDLNQIQASSMDDILKVTPSATMTGGPRRSAQLIQIRGLDSKKTFYYIDGKRQNFRMTYSSPVTIDPENFKKVNIFKSSAATSFGSGLGGGVEILTKDASDFLESNQNFGGLVKTTYQQSNQEKGLIGRVYSRSDGLDSLVSFIRRSANNMRLSDGTRLHNSSYEDQSVSGKFSSKLLGEDKLTFDISYFERVDTEPLRPDQFTFDFLEDRHRINTSTRSSAGLLYNYNPKSNKLLNITANIGLNEQKYLKEYKMDSTKDIREIETINVSVKNKMKLIKVNKFDTKLITGLEVINDKLSGDRGSDPLSTYPSGSGTEVSAFSKINIMPLSKLKVSPGVRFNSYKLKSDNKELELNSGKAISRNIETSYYPTSWLEFKYAYSEGFNAPRVQDVFIEGLRNEGDPWSADNYFIPNTRLSEETSKMNEFGVKLKGSLFTDEDYISIGFNQYYNKLNNYIFAESKDVFFPQPGEFGTTQFVNLKEVFIRGSELKVDYLIDNIELGLTYSRIRGFRISENLNLQNSPADQYTYNAKWFLDNMNLTLGYLGVMTLKQDRINNETVELDKDTPSSFIHNLYIAKENNNGTAINLKIDNITNRKYRRHGTLNPEKGLDFKLGFQYKL